MPVASDRCLVREFRCDLLEVKVFESAVAAGAASALAAAQELRRILSSREEGAAIFASARSQNEFLAAFREQPQIDWTRLAIFHLDEYVGLPVTHSASFRRYLREHLVRHVPVREFLELDGGARSIAAECDRYTALLAEKPPGLAAIGIGENGHLAFIDPGNCSFTEPHAVRVVDLDEVCRMQQVHDGAFARLQEVPSQALSLTVPAILNATTIVVNVTGATKQAAVKAALLGPITEACPASALRRHPRATLFLDSEAAALLDA